MARALVTKAWREKAYMRLRVNGRRMLEHRYVWEQANGSIPDGYSIHHKNHNGIDNRLENLELLPLGEHIRMHKKGKPLPAHVQAAKVIACKNKIWTQEERERLSKSRMGHSTSIETRNKIRQSLMGHFVSEETRRKISETKRRKFNGQG